MKTPLLRFCFLFTALCLVLSTIGCSDDDAATDTKDFPREGLVAYYPFNGNANDESDESNNGSVNGATLTTDRYGNANKAYAFDGTDDYINCGNDESLQITESITICAWVKPGNLGGSRCIVSKYDADNIQGGLNFALSSGNFRWNLGISDIYSSGTGVDQWVFWAATYNGSASKTYRNGTLMDNEDVTGSIKNAAAFNLTIGKFSNGNLAYFIGSIDDLMIYNRALTAAEITEVYNQTITK